MKNFKFWIISAAVIFLIYGGVTNLYPQFSISHLSMQLDTLSEGNPVELTAAQIKAQEHRQKMIDQHAGFVSELAALQKIEKPTKHNLWKIGHMKKMVAHMEGLLRPQEVASAKVLPWYQEVELIKIEMTVMMVILFIGMIFLMGSSSGAKGKARPQKGFVTQDQLYEGTVYQDPVSQPFAQQTYWQPMRPGGANFRTHYIEEHNDQLWQIKSSSSLKAFYLMFLLAGLNSLLFQLYGAGVKHGFTNIWLVVTNASWVGLPFLIVGIFLKISFVSSDYIFDKQKGLFISEGKERYLSSIKALQILQETTGGRDSGVYISYELNVILTDGERVHVMDHGDGDAFFEDAEQLAKFLSVPIWRVQ